MCVCAADEARQPTANARQKLARRGPRMARVVAWCALHEAAFRRPNFAVVQLPMRTFFVVLLFLFLECVGGSAVAQPTGAVNAAREHYRKGTTLFDLSRYAEAAREFELAYEAKPDPALLYNLAQSHRLAGASSAALQAYKAYLRRMPAAPNRAEVESRIAEVQQKLATANDPAAKPTPLPTSTSSNPTPPPLAVTPTTTPPTPLLVEKPPIATTPQLTRVAPSRRATPRWVWGAVAGSVVLVGVVFGIGLGLHYADPGSRSPSIGVGGLE